jgi:hypothetical protein
MGILALKAEIRTPEFASQLKTAKFSALGLPASLAQGVEALS